MSRNLSRSSVRPSSKWLPAARSQWAVQMGAAGAVLAIGVFVYLLDRPASGAWFVPDWWSLVYEGPAVFGRLGQHLPTFAHVYAFILITAILLSPWKHGRAVACLGWFSVDAAFELAQTPEFAAQIANHVPGWLSHWPLLDNFAAYFVAGRFDIYDLCSIAAGTLAAMLTLRFATSHGDGSC